MTLNGEMALILHYFTEFVYDVVVKQLLMTMLIPSVQLFSDYFDLFNRPMITSQNF